MKKLVVFHTKVRDEIERDSDFSNITVSDLQDDIIAPIINEEYKKQVTKRMKHGQYMNILNIL